MPNRSAGVLIPLFSLRTRDDLGCGEISDLPAMAEFARTAGLSIIQLLPLDEVAPGEMSPYSAMSVLAIDPIYVSAGGLPGIDSAALSNARAMLGYGRRISRVVVRAVKRQLMERSFRMPRTRLAIREYEGFADHNREWLEDYALFRALKDHFNFRPWYEWPADLVHREAIALAQARRELAEPIAMYSWWQFLAGREWSAARLSVRRCGVRIGGDLAFSPARDSAEVWANQAMFDLDRTVGAPPDAFNIRGQRWGLPLPRWSRMGDDGFRLWRMRARRAGAMFDLLRIDHVVGIYRTFSFGLNPDEDGAFSPSDENAQVVQGERIMRALLEAAGDCKLVAEDLGSVPGWVRASLTRLRVPGYKVMQWEREGWGGADEKFIPPARYPELSLATTGTHDTETLSSWWRGQRPADRAKLCAALEITGRARPRSDTLDAAGLDAIIEALYASPARYVILPVQDFFGWSARINRPGSVNDSNWTYRLPLTIERLAANRAIQAQLGCLRAIARRTGRL